MQLVMYIGNDFISSAPLDTRRVTERGYIGNIKRHLLQEQEVLLQYSVNELEFFLLNVSSKHPYDQGAECKKT